jgi:hypothetical protein
MLVSIIQFTLLPYYKNREGWRADNILTLHPEAPPVDHNRFTLSWGFSWLPLATIQAKSAIVFWPLPSEFIIHSLFTANCPLSYTYCNTPAARLFISQDYTSEIWGSHGGEYENGRFLTLYMNGVFSCFPNTCRDTWPTTKSSIKTLQKFSLWFATNHSETYINYRM